MNKLAIAINSFNRYGYLKKAIKSLENNLDIDKVDFYLYQDGSVNPFSGERYAEDEDIQRSIRVFQKSKLPNKTLIERKLNLGAGLQRFYLFRDLFNKGYEYVISVDDDLVFGKYYIRTISTLFDQFKDDERIGALHTSLRNYEDADHSDFVNAKKMANQVQLGFGRRWEQGLWKKSWLKIEPSLQGIIEEMETCDFKHLLHEPYMQSTRDKLLVKYGSFHADEAIEDTLIKEGMTGVCTRVPRHKGIGEVGLYTFTPKKWELEKLDKVILYDDLGDVKKFKIFRNKICITIRTLKRANLLRELIRSFRSNDLRGIDFYFYIDGSVNRFSGKRYAEDKDGMDCLRVIQRYAMSFPNKVVDMKKDNKQTAIQKYEMLSSLFPTYEFVMMLDNDLVVNKFYTKTLKTLFEQFKNDPKVGMIQTSYLKERFKENRDLKTSKDLRDRVQYGFATAGRWEQGFYRHAWEKIRPYFKKYMSFAKDCDYKELIKGNARPVAKREEILKYFPVPNTDYVLEFCCYRAGYLGLHTETARYKSVGSDGMYSYTNEEYWKELGFNKIQLFNIGTAKKYKFTAKMNFAEDFKGIFKDKDVYIAGSGPSLDTYPNSFLDGKLGITLHLAVLKFPKATYQGVCESPIIRWLQENKPEFFKRTGIYTYPFHPDDPPQIYLGEDLGRNKQWPPPIFVRYIDNESYLYGTTFDELIEKAIKGEPIIAGAYSTVLHSIMFAVLTMGANRIHFIGIDHAKKGDQTYYSLAQEVEADVLRIRYRGDSWYRPEMCERQKYGTERFIEVCRKNGIAINQYKDYNDWRLKHGLPTKV